MNFILREPTEYPRQGYSKKLRFFMRVSSVYVVLTLTAIGFCAAHASHSQPAEQRMTTIEMDNESLAILFTKIQAQTGLSFISPGKIAENKSVDLPKADRTVKEILTVALQGTGLRYRVKENTIFIYVDNAKAELNEEANETSIGSPAFTVAGKIIDASTQQPLAGVNIIVKGTTRGTTSDAEGKYAIDVEENETLLFSFIGFKTYETQVAGGITTVDITMEVEAASLQEVVINAGYYDVKQKEKTGNISKVTAKDIQKQPVSNPLAALQGRVPGLEIVQSTGVPGGNFKVRIRGTNSIANGNDPLYIVDGVPYTSTTMSFNETSSSILGNSLSTAGGTSPLNSINPSDIESIEVLKDADATAIYGSRGSNGVILITTKKGQVGKTKVDVNFYTGASQTARKLDMLNAQQYLEMRREAFTNDNVTPTIANARDLMVWDTTRHTDWEKKLISGTAHTTDAQVSVSGGEKYTQFSFGVGYHKETTVFPGSNSAQRISSHVNVTNTTPNQKLRTSVSVNYTANNSDLVNKDLTSTAYFLPPNAPELYDENGDLNWVGWDTNGAYENPLAYLKRRYEATANTLFGSLDIGYSILPNLELKSRFGYTNRREDAVNVTPISSLAPSLAPTSLNSTNFSNSTFQNWTVEPQVNWKPKLGNGKFDVLLGTQFLDQTTEGLAQTATGFSSEALMKNIGAAPNRTIGTNYYSQYRYHAVFGRINYNYNGKYIINITGRRDGSSRFGPGKQFANFGAIGAAWIFSNESFVKDAISFLSFGKIRGSYGVNGNDQLRDYEYLDAYTSSSGVQQGVVGLTPVRLSNPDFAWETNKKFEAAIELGFAEDRVLTSVSLYRNRSSNQLVGYPLPPTAGFTSIQANFPATVENTGVEIELATINLRNEDFTWTTALNISVPRNKLVEFPDLAASPAYADTYVVGEPLNIRKLYNYTGIDPTTGIYQFEDVNIDGSFDFKDKQTIEFIGPEFYGGFQNSVTFKGFQLDVMFQFSKQTGRNYIFTQGTPGYMFNQPKYVLNRWQTDGDGKDIQRFGQSSQTSVAYGRLQESPYSISDASFIRLKNLSVSYMLPSKWINKLGGSNARIYVQGQNLITLTNYKGLDPEAQGMFLPPLKTLTGGLSVTF